MPGGGRQLAGRAGVAGGYTHCAMRRLVHAVAGRKGKSPEPVDTRYPLGCV